MTGGITNGLTHVATRLPRRLPNTYPQQTLMNLNHWISNPAAKALRRTRAGAAALLTLSLALACLAPGTVLANGKVADDLQAVVDAGTDAPAISWLNLTSGVPLIKAVVVSNSADPDMDKLRAAVLANGGSVFARYYAVSALLAMLPIDKVATIAARADVASISPNRAIARTASLLELASGAVTVGARSPRTYAGAAYTGLDGSGVGIALLDSGISSNHAAFQRVGTDGSRVLRSVNLQWVGDVGQTSKRHVSRAWTVGVDLSSSLAPDTRARAIYESAIQTVGRKFAQDDYGHGTHVASVAAGRGGFRSPDATGLAPNANLYDVKVLDGAGAGQLADALAGIDWVLHHAKEYNIRVLNVSLAANSTESYLTDPLCRAARAANAAGLTVVVAAGNFGKNAAGVETYGTIAAPGNDPTEIGRASCRERVCYPV